MLPPGSIRACSCTNHPGHSQPRRQSLSGSPGAEREQPGRQRVGAQVSKHNPPTHSTTATTAPKITYLAGEGFWVEGTLLKTSAVPRAPCVTASTALPSSTTWLGEQWEHFWGGTCGVFVPLPVLGCSQPCVPGPPPWGALGVPAQWERQQKAPIPSTWGLWDSKASAQSSPCTGKSPKHKIQKKIT